MKDSFKIYQSLLLLLLPSLGIHAQQQGNYVETTHYIGDGQSLVSYEYFDGLGRKVQTVQKDFTPSGNDLVSFVEYDGNNHVEKEWLPVPMASNGGKQVDASKVIGCSNSQYSDDKAYSTTVYDALGRKTALWGPGKDWYSHQKYARQEYPIVSEIARLVMSGSSAFIVSGKYSKDDLVMEKSTDEDGHVVSNYYDISGNVVATVRHSDSGDLTTYYIYDDADNLRYVLPPAAFKACQSAGVAYSATNTDAVKKYGYYYEYDGRNRCVYKKLPGCEPVLFRYDAQGRPVFSQNGNERQQGVWEFTLYDNYYRKVVTGLCKGKLPDVEHTTVSSYHDGSGKYAGYKANIDLDVEQLLTVDYYEDYGFFSQESDKDHYNFVKKEGYDDDAMTDNWLNFNRLTGTRVYILGSDKYLLKSIYYNKWGQVIQTHASNNMGGHEDVYYHVNTYNGNVLKEMRIHSLANVGGRKCVPSNANATECEVYTYTYDSQGRLLTEKHKMNGAQERVIKSLAYDELGRIKRKSSENTSVAADYSYNVRSQLLKASSPAVTQELYYNTSLAGNEPVSYNGNISAYKVSFSPTKVYNKCTSLSYEYAYDNLNRLVSAFSIDGNGKKSYRGRHNVSVTYDIMGNPTCIERYGINAVDSSECKVDDVDLAYDGNQLQSLTNHAAKIYSFDTQVADAAGNGAVEYQYDANGNMTQDLNKGVLSISYNVLNLPENVFLRNGKAIHYDYAADGTKLAKIVRDCIYPVAVPQSGAVSITPEMLSRCTMSNSFQGLYYCGNYVYEYSKIAPERRTDFPLGGMKDASPFPTLMLSPWLVQLKVDGGYIENTKSPVYYEYVKDYLGNNRFTIKDNAICAVSYYYPFGGYFNESVQGTDMRYRFGNKEVDALTQTYDFGARMYDPTVGRFMNIDPLADSYYDASPYSYCKNNPTNASDPTGMQVHPWGENAFQMIINTLRKEDREYVQLNQDGFIDKEKLNSHNSDSYNYQALAFLVNDPSIVDVICDDKFQFASQSGKIEEDRMQYNPFDEKVDDPSWIDKSGQTMGGTSTGESGFMGKTLFPDNIGQQNSPDANIKVVVNSHLSSPAAAEMYSHEANGHALLYLQNGHDHLGASHKPNEKMIETNTQLKRMILRSKQETIKNMMEK